MANNKTIQPPQLIPHLLDLLRHLDVLHFIIIGTTRCYVTISHYFSKKALQQMFGDRDEYTTLNSISIDDDSTIYDFSSFEQLNTYHDTVRFNYESSVDLDDIDIAALNFACGIDGY